MFNVLMFSETESEGCSGEEERSSSRPSSLSHDSDEPRRLSVIVKDYLSYQSHTNK